MSVTVCQTPAARFCVDSPPSDTWLTPTKNTPKQDLWTLIQSQNSPSAAASDSSPTYVHPLVRRSSTLMSNSNLQMCTESLGSETGSGDFSDDDHGLFNYSSEKYEVVENKKTRQSKRGLEEGNQLTSVMCHCSASRKSVTRSFPPPLPSLSRHDGTCIQMRTSRHCGRVFVEAVPVASVNYLHARRHDGRLLLTFVHSPSAHQNVTETKVHIHGIEKVTQKPHILEEQHLPAQIAVEPKDVEHYQGEAHYEEDKEEVEVVDRGSMVEVKVSMHLQQEGGYTWKTNFLP